jgi:uncharacterized membrane protein YadS
LTHGPDALAVATTVKLARALWIVPVALALGWWFGRHGGRRRGSPPIPWFIGGFLLLSALFTFVPSLGPVQPVIARGARTLLTLTLFFIGAGLSRHATRAAGLRPFLLGLSLWMVVGSTTLAAIQAGWL